MENPWNIKPLDEWNIVGMNHYRINGQKRLFVAMTKDGRCIQEEGPDDRLIWTNLFHKAVMGCLPPGPAPVPDTRKIHNPQG